MTEFVLFSMILLGIMFFHHKQKEIAFVGLAVLVVYKMASYDTFSITEHVAHESNIIMTLFGLITGFSVLAEYVKKSGFADVLPNYLSDTWWGAFQLLGFIFLLSSVLDNIAAAMIGGTLAGALFKKVHVGYVVAIVAASNAGGAWSVVGDTTTTMMWIAGKSPKEVFHAIIPSVIAFMFFGFFAARQQHKHSPIMKDNPVGAHIEWIPINIVLWSLVFVVAGNVWCNTHYPEVMKSIPVMALILWIVLGIGFFLKPFSKKVFTESAKGSLFLLALVMCASLMPIEKLPVPSPTTTFGLGIVSAVFDNIPLTALSIKQGMYDWGALAFAVGFGGSMSPFGSSAGVAICVKYPEARKMWLWIKHGWHVPVGYVMGYAVLMVTYGWHPTL